MCAQSYTNPVHLLFSTLILSLLLVDFKTSNVRLLSSKAFTANQECVVPFLSLLSLTHTLASAIYAVVCLPFWAPLNLVENRNEIK